VLAQEGIAQGRYYTWSKEFMEAGKRRLAGDTARAATNGEGHDLCREARALKECVVDLTLENRLLKKSMIADGGDEECGIPHRQSSRSSALARSGDMAGATSAFALVMTEARAGIAQWWSTYVAVGSTPSPPGAPS
jgi:hypothetical protein